MNNFRNWLARMLYGRYGVDLLGRVLVIAAFVLCIVSIFTSQWVYIASFMFLGVAYFRIFSKNITARRQENERFMNATAGIRRLFSKNKQSSYERRNYKIFKCPKCKQKLRLPRHRGKIEIRCRKCGCTFIRRT